MNNFHLLNLVISHTSASVLPRLKSGDNIVHFMVNKQSGDSLILQKLLEKLELELGSKEAVGKEVLMEKSKSDELDGFEYGAVNKFYLPILLQYSFSFYRFRYQEDHGNDLAIMSKVMNVQITHCDQPVSSKLDQKFKEGMCGQLIQFRAD